MGTIRTFVAFDTPDKIRRDVVEVQSALKRSDVDVRWESLEKFHVTIKFLGNVNEERLPAIYESVDSVCRRHQPFEIVYGGLGAFPSMRQPRVVWIGCENPDGGLFRIKSELDHALLPFGFAIEDRDFHPHVTLGRVKSARRIEHLTSMLESLTFDARTVTIGGILVMRSVLEPQGARYSILKSIHLQSEQHAGTTR